MGDGLDPVSEDMSYALDPLSEEVLEVASAINEVWEESAESPFAGLVVDQRAGMVTAYRVAGENGTGSSWQSSAQMNRSDLAFSGGSLLPDAHMIPTFRSRFSE